MASTVELSVCFHCFNLKASGWTVQMKQHWQRFSSIFWEFDRHSLQAQVSRTLFCLTAPGRLSFDTSHSLRSGTFHDWEIDTLYRLAGHLEKPTWSHARKLISKAMVYRNLTVPGHSRPVSFLSHGSLCSVVQRFLRAHVVPVHLPTTKVREAAAPKLSHLLFNQKRHPDLLCVDLPVCSCFQIWRRLRYDCRGPCPPDGQCVLLSAALTDLRLHSGFSIFQNANMQSMYSKRRAWDAFFREYQSELDFWSQHHGLPLVDPLTAHQFLLHQWPLLHKKELRLAPRFTENDLRRLQYWLSSDVILHHADHEIHRLTFFALGCTVQVQQTRGTMISCSMLFLRFRGTSEEAKAEAAMALPTHLQTKYKWGITKHPLLPNGCVVLKRKKQILNGRALVSDFRTNYALLMQTTAHTIDSMCAQLWPQPFGQLSVPNIWKRINYHFESVVASVSFGIINDDSVVFFNFIPQERLLDAIQSLVLAWKQRHGGIQLSVDMSMPGPIQHTTFVGQVRSRGSHRTILPDDLIGAVAASLRSHIFWVGNLIFKQFRGAGLGAHISPSWRSLAVTMVEFVSTCYRCPTVVLSGTSVCRQTSYSI